MDTTGWGWDQESLQAIFNSPKPLKKKYVITDDRDEFIERLEIINEMSFKQTNNNLRYLEQLDKIKEIKAGADVEIIFPWVKECNNLL